VHAGLIPGAAIGHQDPLSLITTRNLIPRASAKVWKRSPLWEGTTDQGRGVPWASKWTGPEHIYYGHNTHLGVQHRPFSTGLDTGCVYGGKLTAAILEPPSPEYRRVCQQCASPLVSPKCTHQYRCKVGQCSNKYPCRRSDPRCPRPGCSMAPMSARHAIISIPARATYDLNAPWRKAKRGGQRGGEEEDVGELGSQFVEEAPAEQRWLLARQDVDTGYVAAANVSARLSSGGDREGEDGAAPSGAAPEGHAILKSPLHSSFT
jgi:hypothetical protein